MTPCDEAVAQPATPRPDARTKKMAKEVVKGANDTFQDLDGTRPPGWAPDTADLGGPKIKYWFPNEAIGLRIVDPVSKKKELIPFKTPKGNSVDFDEPGTPGHPATPQERLDFLSWILGADLTKPTDPKDDQVFFNFLNELAPLVRRYNAALYWLRRVHYAANDPGDSPPMPRNPHEPDQDNAPTPPLKTDPKLKTDYIPAAQQEWTKAIDALNAKLSDGPVLIDIKADMLEVNGYIVSMRVVCNRADRQIGGSSSSHVSISSTFSAK